jgi:hypothetical protein
VTTSHHPTSLTTSTATASSAARATAQSPASRVMRLAPLRLDAAML